MNASLALLPVSQARLVLKAAKTASSLMRGVARGRKPAGSAAPIVRYDALREEILSTAEGRAAWAIYCEQNGFSLDHSAEGFFGA